MNARPSMHIAVLGAGAMGSLFGGRLAEAGQQVTLIDLNDAHLEAIRTCGLRLRTDAGDRRITQLAACRPEQATDAPDLLLVFTKTMHTQAALRGVQHLLGPATDVLTLQNGLGSVEAIEPFVPRERILVGVTTWPADMAGPGDVHSHGEGTVRLMTADGAARPSLERCVQALGAAGLNCEADRQVWAAIWEKVAFNAALNGICAVTGCTVDQLDRVPEGRALALTVVGEVAAVAQAHGVPVDPERPAQRVVHAIEHHVGHKPSMLQDVLAGRPTEVQAIHGAAVAAASERDVPVPCTATLLALVRLVEARAADARATEASAPAAAEARAAGTHACGATAAVPAAADAGAANPRT